MDNHFLTDIEIIDFKCFQNFKASGFKRVNLIAGKNNIGKTAFMEACAINVASKDVDTMINAILLTRIPREKPNLVANALFSKNILFRKFLDAIKHYKATSNNISQDFAVKESSGKKEYVFNINNDEKIINANELNNDFILELDGIDNFMFIDSFGLNDDAMIYLFKPIQEKDKEKELNIFINNFDKNIINFKIIKDKPVCKVNDKYRDLVEFGDGLKHYISIICSLYACENGYLFIDEIDNGIHYQQLDQIWEIILTISKETNCQVFATTHSKEMIEYFARVSQKLNEQDISFTTLVKNKENEIKALTRDSEMLLDSVKQEREVRGW